MKPQTLWQRVSRAAQDYYLIIGSALVGFLLLLAVLGPLAAPHNPSLVKPLQWIEGELHKAPIPPGDLFLLGTDDLGRDQLSLLLYGARTTLVMALVATIVRMLLGLVLGALAGWWAGSGFDRTVTAVTELLAAVPALILAMLVVYAVGIQRGQVAFVAALSLVGWGEVAQIVRGHVMGIRSELFVEAATATGLSSPAILSRHVLPNLLPTLLAIAALEMGAALLLLAELGFVHVFIGGGRIGYDETAREARHYFDAPDWGAMLGSSWRWFRSYPWYPLAPAAAFFVSTLAFNLFGHGLQRFIERGRFYPSGWSVLRFLLVIALVLLGARTLLQGASLEARLVDLAHQFEEDRAWEDVSHLVQIGLNETSSGPEKRSQAADYIASQFEWAGLSPASPDGSYLRSYTAIQGHITAAPALKVLAADGEPGRPLPGGISFDPWQAFNGEGSVEAELVVQGNTDRAMMFEGGIVLLLDPGERIRLPWHVAPPHQAILRLVPDDELGPGNQIPPFDRSGYGGVDSLPTFPSLLIGESAARAVLARAGADLDQLRAAMKAGERIALHTGLTIQLTYGLVYQEVPAANVVGYIAGLDVGSRGERVLVTAAYAGASLQGGATYPGADRNASGVAVMLETARLLNDLELVPKRTILFAAFDVGGGSQFVISPPIPTRRSDVWTTVMLHGLAAGESRLARLESSPGQSRAFDRSARHLNVRTTDLEEWRFFFVTGGSRLRSSEQTVHKSYQGLAVTRIGDVLSEAPDDSLEHLSLELLADAGRAVAHYVLVLGSR